MDYINLGSTPCDEECVQVETGKDYLPTMTEECRRYKKLLENLYPIPEEVNAHYTIKSFPHDFGTYKEVAIVFDSEDEAAAAFAYEVEDRLPANW